MAAHDSRSGPPAERQPPLKDRAAAADPLAMGLASVLCVATGAVALCAALGHGGLWGMGRRRPEHLWFALAALGVAGLAVSTAGLYEATSVAEAEPWQRAQLCFSVAILVGLVRFSLYGLAASRPLLEAFVLGFGVLVLALALGTDQLFSGEPVLRRFPPLGLDYVESGLDGMAAGVCTVYTAILALVLHLHVRAARRGEPGARALQASAGIVFVAALSDVAVGHGLYVFPSLFTYGCLAAVLGVSGATLRRLARSLGQAERIADNLHELVEKRTAELRSKDLQIAHGTRMAAIGALAAGVAHEINNPIAFITANLNQLEEVWKRPEEADEALEMLTDCREGVERVRAIVTDLLTLARPSEGTSEMVNVTSIVSSVLSIARHEARDRAELITRLDPTPPVRGDARLLGQVVLNLVLNAAQAIEPGTGRNHRIEVSTGFENGHVRLCVRDTGCGIADDVLPHIFEPFFTTKPAGQGTGLGLAVSEQIVREHGGRIRVRSGERGTLFTVELPPAD